MSASATHSGPFGSALIEQQRQSDQHPHAVQTVPEHCSVITGARMVALKRQGPARLTYTYFATPA